jgi:crotonobetainyl-CoA:carnitine CoA-transferase CaiB-like acyl-CoA transferase
MHTSRHGQASTAPKRYWSACSTRFRLSATPDVVQVPAPLLGQHNDYVLSELLGFSQADINCLTMAGVVVAVT